MKQAALAMPPASNQTPPSA